MFDSTYVSTTIPLGPAEAATVADHWHRRLAQTAKASRFVRGADRLWLAPELGPVEADRFGVRRAPGILWVGGLPVPIEFELTVWSATTTVLAIRPRGRTPLFGVGRYTTTAHRALEYVAQSFLITRECLSVRTEPYRSVKDALLERKFQWPAPTVPSPSVFPRPQPVPEAPRVTAGSR